MTAKYNGTCAETGKPIRKGDHIFYDGKAYCKDSKKYQSENEATNTSAYIQAQEDAYWDNVTGYYYSR